MFGFGAALDQLGSRVVVAVDDRLDECVGAVRIHGVQVGALRGQQRARPRWSPAGRRASAPSSRPAASPPTPARWPCAPRSTSGTRSASSATFTSAPSSSSRPTASALFSAAAHIKAVSPSVPSARLTSAPCATSTLIASGVPVRAARISTVLALRQRRVGIGTRLEQRLEHGGVAVDGRERQRADAVAVRGARLGPGPQQELHRRQVVARARPSGAPSCRRPRRRSPLRPA